MNAAENRLIATIVGPSLLYRQGKFYFDSIHRSKPIDNVARNGEILNSLKKGNILTLGDLIGKDFLDLKRETGISANQYYFLLLSLRSTVLEADQTEALLQEDPTTSPSGIQNSATEMFDLAGERFWPHWPEIHRPLILQVYGESRIDVPPHQRSSHALFFASMVRMPDFEAFAMACLSNVSTTPMTLKSFQNRVEEALGWMPEQESETFRVLLYAIRGIKLDLGPNGPMVVLSHA